MLCIFTMGSLHLLEGPDPVVADQAEWKWWLESDGPPSHSYIRRGKRSGWELMNSRKWRKVTKSLPGLWRDAYVKYGKTLTVTEIVAVDDCFSYNLTLEYGERVTYAPEIEGHNAKRAVLFEMIGIPDYQRYETAVCQATPSWDTIIRLCLAKGVTVTRVTAGWIFES